MCNITHFVRTGLTWWINNGRVEGHVTELKFIKRQGSGRADFPLLRKRVPHADLDGEQEVLVPSSLLMIPSAIIVLVQSAQVVDLACVVEVMLNDHVDDPASLFQFIPARQPRAEQFGVIQDSDTFSEPLLAFLQPRSGLRNGGERVMALDEGIVPAELRVAEGVIVVHVLTAADVPDDVADRALSKRGNPEPVLGRDGVEVAQERMPIRSPERLIKEIYELSDGRCCHDLHYTTKPVPQSMGSWQLFPQSGYRARLAANDVTA
jgi:hypothetical protein